jgi:hypothetical protein
MDVPCEWLDLCLICVWVYIYLGVYGELGRSHCISVDILCIIKYWCKIVQSENIIIQRLYGTMVDKANNSIVITWVHKVKSLLDNNGLSYVWYNSRSSKEFWYV